MPGPTASAHQVLVYSGSGVSPLSLSHTLLTLSLHLLPHYTVQPVTADTLSTQPWEPSCALLVIPGGRDLPYVEELTMKTRATRRIQAFVQEGGRYLGICAGAYFASAEVKFDVGGGLEVSGQRDLSFFPGACVGPTYPGFDYTAESGARAISLFLDKLSTSKDRTLDWLYYNGGGHYVLPVPIPSKVEVLARYASSESDQIAAVLTRNGKGKAVLCSVHFEYPLSNPPARDAILKSEHPPEQDEIERSEKDRIEWVADLLRTLDLKPIDRNEVKGISTPGGEDPTLLLHPTHPSPIFVFPHPNLGQLGTETFAGLQSKLMPMDDGWEGLRDANDELIIGPVSSIKVDPTSGDPVSTFLAQRRRATPESTQPDISTLSLESSTPAPPVPIDFHTIPKTILLPAPTRPYSSQWTPLFNFDTYWAEVDQARKRQGRKSGVLRSGGAALGDLVWYGETVTSTQTMLDRNPLLLTNLPAPLAFLASFQLSGRGRGSNIWLSPPGCLQFSLLLTLPQSLSTKMVFIQYLMALAVCEAVDEDGKLGVRIKWPNDIYAEVEGVGGTELGGGVKGKAKLGGILVNTNFVGGQWRIVIGCGINVLNALPTTSLSQLHSLLTTNAAASGSTQSLPPPPTMEATFAKIMTSFEMKWEQFIEEKGFKGFMNEYHGRWLHSNQLVTLTTTEPHTPLKILSITPDYGLLRCIPTAPQKVNGLTPLYDRGDHHDDDRGFSTSRTASVKKEDQFVDLQPDGNSFDLMSGMIKRKV